jgi:hypothetical protein
MEKSFGAGQKFKIVIKRDFGRRGFWINRQWVKTGFVVTRGGANIMPGATWFRTVDDAMKAIRIYCESSTSEEFWAKWRAA